MRASHKPQLARTMWHWRRACGEALTFRTETPLSPGTLPVTNVVVGPPSFGEVPHPHHHLHLLMRGARQSIECLCARWGRQRDSQFLVCRESRRSGASSDFLGLGL